MKKERAYMKYLVPLLALLLTAAGAVPASAERAGTVVRVRGRARIERPSGSVVARVRAALQVSDSVTTRKRSRVKMLFRDDSILTIGSNSRLVIKKYLYDPKNKRAESLYELADGRLRSVVGGKGFKVVTPTAFAAARGTVFTVFYDPETGTTAISVTEGAVEVRNADPGVKGVQVVRAGQSTSVSRGLPPTPPTAGRLPSFDDGGGDLPGIARTGGGLLNELRDQREKLAIDHPIGREPAAATSTSLDVRFR